MIRHITKTLKGLLPPDYSVSVGKLPSGNIRVTVARGIGAYNLTITEPDEPISVENIANNAKHLLEAV